MEEPQELILKSMKFPPSYISYLETIDENISNANRRVIKSHMRGNFERYFLLFAIGLIFIVFSTFITNLLFAFIVMFIGVVYIGYSSGVSLKLFIRSNKV